MSRHLSLYTTFHLNLAYSSIEEEQRAEVVRRCYWPLLRLVRELGIPFGIEAPAYTLEAAALADPSWLEELRALTNEGLCEFVGSGYAQVIAPLVPADVNAANLRLGQQRYEELLGFRPTLGLFNEQAYAAGLLDLYAEAGFEAVVMEWDNPASEHPEWDAGMRYLPQIALGQHGEEIPLLWNKSLAFQKFQRYVHGEMDLAEYLAYLGTHAAGEGRRAFALYGNDIEVFDFRPGRFHTEAALEDGVEWQRIRVMLEALLADGRFEFIAPSRVLDLMGEPGAGTRIHLESAAQPVPVKKQGKYNLTRWAVTPRDDLHVNTACWRLYECLRSDPAATDEQWRELCYLWSSDFRTHITEKRWAAYLARLDSFASALGATLRPQPAPPAVAGASTSGSKVTRGGRFLEVANEHTRVRLNTRRGLAIDALSFPSLGDDALAGTIEHGYYDDIALGADYYTGHMTLEPPGVAKVTDLEKVEPEVIEAPCGVEVLAMVRTPIGSFRKRVWVSASEPAVRITYEFDWDELPLGSFRLGHVTVLPTAFERSTLYYATHNGGRLLERFPLEGARVDQGRPVSSLVSASGGLGVTGGVVEIGDASRGLRIEVDKSAAALIGLMTYRDVRGSYFCRLSFSAFELDETARLAQHPQPPAIVSMTIGPRTA